MSAPLKMTATALSALVPSLAASVAIAHFAPLAEADALLAATLAFPFAWLVWMILLSTLVLKTRE